MSWASFAVHLRLGLPDGTLPAHTNGPLPWVLGRVLTTLSFAAASVPKTYSGSVSQICRNPILQCQG